MKTLSRDKNLFLVSSAINATHGIYDPKTRLLQTTQTCSSILKKINANIILLDGGSEPLNEAQTKIISKYCKAIINFSESDYAKQFQSTNNWDIVKNGIEIYMFKYFMDLMCSNKIDGMSEVQRVFKMSGRYVLDNSFKRQVHIKAKDKIVIKKEVRSQFRPGLTKGIDKQYMSRLWSFDISLKEYVKEFYDKSFEHFKNLLSTGNYADIEHLLYYFLDEKLLKKVSKIGVSGTVASNGLMVTD